MHWGGAGQRKGGHSGECVISDRLSPCPFLSQRCRAHIVALWRRAGFLCLIDKPLS
jgi:hypothetical protein